MKKWLGRLALILFGLLMAVVMLEALLRLMPGFLPPNLQLALRVRDTVAQRSQLFYEDSDLGHVLKPGLNAEVDMLGEFSFHVQTSDLGLGGPGFRDQDVQIPAYAVAIGDSFTYGLGVEEPATWVARLQDDLGEEVVNLGQPGIGPVRENRIYQQYGRRLQPQVVLWMVVPNDLEDAMVFNGFGRPGQEPDWLDRAFDALRPWSRLALVIEFSLGRGPFAWAGGYEIRQVRDQVFFFQPGFITKQIDLADPYIEKGWWISRNALADAVAAAHDDGSRFILILAPPRERVYIDLLTDDPPHAPFNTDALFARYKDLGDELGFEVLDLTEPFVEAAQSGEILYFSRDGHWNAAGHALAARELTAYLSK